MGQGMVGAVGNNDSDLYGGNISPALVVRGLYDLVGHLRPWSYSNPFPKGDTGFCQFSLYWGPEELHPGRQS